MDSGIATEISEWRSLGALRKAYAEGSLVLFAGAGVSRYAGLGDFKEVTDHLESKFIEKSPSIVKENISAQPFLEIITDFKEKNEFPKVLESYINKSDELLGQKSARSLFQNILTEYVLKKYMLMKGSGKELIIHSEVKKLATSQGNNTQLITTNWDRFFCLVEPNKIPYLGIPSGIEWDGTVYLHGQISEQNNIAPDIIFSERDYTQKYSDSARISSFLHELLTSNKTVLFMGYSFNDPFIKTLIMKIDILFEKFGRSGIGHVCILPDEQENRIAAEKHKLMQRQNVLIFEFYSTISEPAKSHTIQMDCKSYSFLKMIENLSGEIGLGRIKSKIESDTNIYTEL